MIFDDILGSDFSSCPNETGDLYTRKVAEAIGDTLSTVKASLQYPTSK